MRFSAPTWGSRASLHDSWRAHAFSAFWGLPNGPIGWVGARILPIAARRVYEAAAEELHLRPDDALLDVGCGAGTFLSDQAAEVRFVAGLDASQIQVRLARKRLAARIAAGTAEIVLGDAAALPWGAERFSAVASLDCLKFVPDPDRALLEIHRVMRPGGRFAHITDPPATAPDTSGTVDVYGVWQWSRDDSRRMMQRAGFSDVSVTQLPARYFRLQLVRGVKPIQPPTAG